MVIFNSYVKLPEGRILSGVGGCVCVGVCSFWHKAVFFPPEAQKYTSMKILQPYTLV